jgi:hypothetical protein
VGDILSGVKVAIPRNKRCHAPKLEEKRVRVLGDALNAGYTYLRFAASAAVQAQLAATAHKDFGQRSAFDMVIGEL